MILDDKRVLVTGGTGSLGNVLVRRILDGEIGKPDLVTVFSRSEAKQHAMQVAFHDDDRLRFRLGDVGLDFHSVVGALRNQDIVLHCAAHKQVVSAEYTPITAVQTNVMGAANIVKAICDLGLPIETVVFISTDKACSPANLYGATKYVQERIFTQANLECSTRFVGVRYGNVLASAGSVIPLFHEQIRRGGPVTITDPNMTRFLMSLDGAVNTIFAALLDAARGEIYVPCNMPSASIADLASVLIGDRDVVTKVIGIRPGEKLHEALISEEESSRTMRRGTYFAIAPTLPELSTGATGEPFGGHEFSSADGVLDRGQLDTMIRANHLMIEDNPTFQ